MSSPGAQAGATAGSSDDFVTYVGALYDLAVKYNSTSPANGGPTTPGSNPGDANQRVVEWLRHQDYNNLKWNLLTDSVDETFISFVVASSPPAALATYQDPRQSVQIKISHLGAVVNAVLVKGAATTTAVNRADLAGWGGNLLSFYSLWRTAVRKATSPIDTESYFQTNLAQTTGGDPTFTMANLIEVADGYNIASRLLADSTLGIADAVKQNLQADGAYKTRLHDFYTARFGGTATQTIAVVQSLMLSCDDNIIAAGRWRLIYAMTSSASDYPSEIAIDDLQAFYRGFADTLQGLVKQEAAA